MPQAGSLYTSLTLESSSFYVGLKKAVDQSAKSSKAIEGHLNSLKNGVSAMFALAGGGALVAAAAQGLDYASSLGEIAQQLGVTTRELQEYRFAGSQVGVSTEQMDTALSKLTKTIGEAKAGSKAQATTFRELGVSIQDANGKVYTAGEVIPKLADALSKVKDPATRARLEVELFGRTGQKLDTLLASGSKGVNELREAAQKLGVVLSDKQIQNADDTADKLAALKQVLEAKVAGAVADNVTAIMSLADAMGYLVGKASDAIKALVRFKAQQGIFEAKNSVSGIRGIFATDADRKEAAKKVKGFQDIIVANGGTVNDPAYLRQKALRDAIGLNTPAKPAEAVVPDGALPTVKETPKKETGPTAADRAENFQQEADKLDSDQLGLKQQISTDLRERAMLEHQRIATDQAAYEFDLDTKVRANQLNAADAERLKIVNARNAELQDTAVNWQLDDDLLQQEVNAKRQALQTQNDILQDQSNMARTAKERREIELKILANQIALEKLTLQQVLDSHASAEEKANAQARMDALPGLQAGATANINRQNMGPLASYLDSLPKTADEVNEAFEHIAANGIQNMVDGLAQSAANVLKLKGLAGQLFNQIIADVIRLNLQQGLTGSGGGLLGGIGKLFGFVGGSGDAALQAAAANAGNNLPGLAVGGTIGGFGGTDRNVLSINGIPRARVSANERITVHPNAGNDNGAMRIQVVKGDLFDLIVDRRADARVGAASPGIVSGASTGTQTAIQRKQSRRLA